MTQSEDLFHHLAVIPLTGVRALIGSAGAVSAIHLFTQGLVVAVGHYRQVAWDIQRQQVAFQLFRFGLGFCRSQRAFRHPRQLRFVGNEFGPAHRRIEDVVAVLVAQLGKTSGNLTVALLFLYWQTDAREFEVAQCVINRFFLSRVQRGVMIAIAQVAIRFIQPFMLPYPGAVFRQQRQGLFVRFTQFRAIFHRVQVADRGEDTPQHIVHFRQRLAEIFPGVRCSLRYYALHIFAAVVQRLSHGWNDMFRENFRKRRQFKGSQ
ncbi:hypothetical protein ExPUPEC96_03458 [Escherichia coli]|nr:hypothetical protein ExPUPEC96_03458 [Escherichia coli]